MLFKADNFLRGHYFAAVIFSVDQLYIFAGYIAIINNTGTAHTNARNTNAMRLNFPDLTCVNDLNIFNTIGNAVLVNLVHMRQLAFVCGYNDLSANIVLNVMIFCKLNQLAAAQYAITRLVRPRLVINT